MTSTIRGAIWISLSCLVPTLVWLAGSLSAEVEIGSRTVAALLLALALGISLGHWRSPGPVRLDDELSSVLLFAWIPLPLSTALVMAGAVSAECIARGTALILLLGAFEALCVGKLASLSIGTDTAGPATLAFKVAMALSIWHFRATWLAWVGI